MQVFGNRIVQRPNLNCLTLIRQMFEIINLLTQIQNTHTHTQSEVSHKTDVTNMDSDFMRDSDVSYKYIYERLNGFVWYFWNMRHLNAGLRPSDDWWESKQEKPKTDNLWIVVRYWSLEQFLKLNPVWDDWNWRKTQKNPFGLSVPTGWNSLVYSSAIKQFNVFV